MGAPLRGCQCFYCRDRRSAWRTVGLVLLALVALLSTGLVLAGEGAEPSALAEALAWVFTGAVAAALLFVVFDLVRGRRP